MSCPTPTASLDICPTRDEIVPQLLALLPRGRAWATHDGGPFPGMTSYSFWTAVADIWAWINARICALALEFVCQTQTETNDLWMEEYGLPDGCDPFPDLCTKVAAQGGTRCEYYVAMAAQAGWSITCWDINDACGTRAGKARAGGSMTGKGLAAGQLFILVSLANSPAYVGGARTPPLAGRMRAGNRLTCPPDLTALECLLAHLVGAEKQVTFGTT